MEKKLLTGFWTTEKHEMLNVEQKHRLIKKNENEFTATLKKSKTLGARSTVKKNELIEIADEKSAKSL